MTLLGSPSRANIATTALTGILLVSALLSPSTAAASTSVGSVRAEAAGPAARAQATAAAGFVRRVNTSLELDGRPYRFVGLNLYNANSRDNCWYPLNRALDTALDDIGPAQTVFRAWFFQWLATDKRTGARDWTAFDRTLAAAAARGQKVIATLTDQWGACEGTGTKIYKLESWYQSGYLRKDPNVAKSYRDWVAEIVARYRGDPTILAWQLMNEAEIKPVFPGKTCGSPQTLRRWADDVARVVKSIDRDHLVSLGTMGGGQCGARGTDYLYVHGGPDIDLCEYHDYNAPTKAMPGDRWNGLATRLGQCGTLNKPLFVGETGITGAQAGASLTTRAAYFDAKLAAQFAAGVVGELVWDWRNGARGGSGTSSYDVGPHDPALAVLAKYAASR